MSDRIDGEIMLFGVRVKVDPMRKSASMNNLSDYAPPDSSSLPVAAAEGGAAAAGYASADDAVPLAATNVSRERKRGVPWTEKEHKLFLIGLQKVGKGDWRGISNKYVKTRNPTQVASHAQKYFLRHSKVYSRRRRSSLFDITNVSVNGMSMGENINHQEESPPISAQQPITVPLPVTSNANRFSVVHFPVNVGPVLLSMQGGNPMENSALDQSARAINNPSAMLVCPVPVFPPATHSMMSNLNLYQQTINDPSSLSLSLSLSSGHDNSSTRGSAFQVISSFKHGDSFISVA